MSDKTICSKELCTGCKACVQICPKNAIDIVVDSEGFEYPKKNNKCINCGLCERICPILNDVNIKNKLSKEKVLTARLKDEEYLLKSSSGGAFTGIVNAFCDKNYIIFGVEFNDKNKAVHTYVEDKNKIDKYRKSKYVQSDIGNSYIYAKKFLDDGKKVLFTGTPCQIAGLKNYLKKDYDNLLTVDLVCHGVPSYLNLNKYLVYIENKYKSNISHLNFREKTCKKNKWNSRNIHIELKNGKNIIENSTKNYYLRGFHGKLFYRPSCKKCKFANTNRISDITIGDNWGINKIYPELNEHKGQSVIIINTEKGMVLYNKICENMFCKEIKIEDATRGNQQLRIPTKFSEKREFFFKNIDSIRYDKLINKCVPKKYLVPFIKKIVPQKLKNYIKKMIVSGGNDNA